MTLGRVAWPALAVLALALGGAAGLRAPRVPDAPYPETRRDSVVETLFGERIADPYRWLENDVRGDPEVADWVRRENAYTEGYLATLPAREWFASHIRELTDYERFGLPRKAGRRYFYLHNRGLQNQSVLEVRDGLDGTARLLLDPNTWQADGTAALDPELWEPSPDGRLLAYGVQQSGSDWRVIHVLDVKRAKVLADELRWVNQSSIAWTDRHGFLYSRFPAPRPGEEFHALNLNHALWYHRVGTAQAADSLVYATPAHPEWNHTARVTSDHRFAVITTSLGTDARHEIHVIDLAAGRRRNWEVRPLVQGFTHDWTLVDSIGSVLWFVTNWQAPRCRLMTIDLAEPLPQWHEVVREGPEVLQQASIIGDELILTYLHHAATRAFVVDLHGGPLRSLSLNEIGTAAGFHGKPGDPETFYSFSSFNRPATIYRADLASGATKVFAAPKIGFDPEDYAVEQLFYTSRDGTRVPMFLVRRKDIARAHRAVPTLLYGYGGFDISLTPGYAASRMAWLQAGGAFALANLRGGGEYGKAWHDAGRLANKQNVFDDFIAAGEYLIAGGITPKGGLAIQGGSNGGLLVAAVTNQRPDLFAAANPAVGVMDMLRFDRFTSGRTWTDDYGHPDRPADFKVLRAYSPYHNIKSGSDYPAILVTTADTDDRVVPGHSFKYTAALQAAALGPRPHLIRIDTSAGHGSGKPTDKAIAEAADELAFLAYWSGLEVK